MKYQGKIISIVLLATLLLNIVAMFDVAATPVQQEDDSVVIQDIQVSTHDRERWFDNRWHHREFITIMVKDPTPRHGRVVKYKIDISDIVDFDLNSIRLMFNLTEIPFDYDFINGIITFVIDQETILDDVLQYTVYFDSLPNGAKPIVDYHPEWAANLVQGVENGSFEQQANSEGNQVLADNGIAEVDGHYFYGTDEVYQGSNGNFYYEDGSALVGQAVIYDPFDNMYFLLDGNTKYEVMYNDVTSTWIYVENGSTVDTAILLEQQYTINGDIVSYNTMTSQWEYTNGTMLVGYLYYNATDDFYYAYHYNETLANYYVTVMYDNATGFLYIWNGTEFNSVAPYRVDDQSFFMGSQMFSQGDVTIGDAVVSDWNVGNVEASMTMTAPISVNGDDYTQTMTTTAWNGVPEMLVEFDNDVPEGTNVIQYGSVLINLDGTLVVWDGTQYVEISSEMWDPWTNQQFLEMGIWEDYTALMLLYENHVDQYTDQLAANWEFVTEDYTFDIGDHNFDIEGVDLTGIYDTGIDTTSFADYELDVIPIIMSSSYFGIHDKNTGSTAAIKFLGPNPYTDILLELWKETITELVEGDPIVVDVNYYINVSFNYQAWWAENDPLTPIVNDIVDFGQSAKFDYLMTWIFANPDPQSVLDSWIKSYETNDPSLLYDEGAIPVNIILHSPVPGQVVDEATDLLINVTVSGETLDYAQYYLDVDGVLMTFDQWNDVILGNGDTRHVGRRMSAVRRIRGIDRATINIIAYDTNGMAMLASADIIVDGQVVDEVVWSITIGSISFILGILGMASVKNKKTRAACIGGKCNIK